MAKILIGAAYALISFLRPILLIVGLRGLGFDIPWNWLHLISAWCVAEALRTHVPDPPKCKAGQLARLYSNLDAIGKGTGR